MSKHQYTATRPTKRTHSLRYASVTGKVEAVKQPLAFGVSPTTVTGHWETPVHTASRSGYTEMLHLLLEEKQALISVATLSLPSDNLRRS